MVQTPTREHEVSLAELVGEIEHFEGIVSTWEDHHQLVAIGLKRAIESLHREALTRLIRHFKSSALPALKSALTDEVIYGLLRYHELVKPSLQERLQFALTEARPALNQHNGDVELISIRFPDTVEVRFTGSCSHCPASALTLSELVETKIKYHCPEILHVIEVNTVPVVPEKIVTSDLTSWRLITSLAEIPDGGVLGIKMEGQAILLYRKGMEVTAFRNACSHLGMAIDAGEITDNILTCPHHYFQYRLDTGECLTVADLPLPVYPVQVRDGLVYVEIDRM
jgi:nitrite reductase/ring-hydroxylating ferredoxin subunit/Fe-S cluster biogenesis protein NfuA